MKELSIEEKAKRYDEILARAKGANIPYYKDKVKEFVDYLIPELKESEDERIAKSIKRILKSFYDYFFPTLEGFTREELLSWIEKQYEQKPFDYENANIQQSDFSPKVDPKFREGEWVIYNNDICQIVKREEGCNKLVTVFGIEKELVNERNLSTARLWTIADAKDGDVIATDNYTICICDGTVEDGIYPFAYCGLTRYGFEYYDRKLPFTHNNNVHPATKKQRDILFQKMKEAGYEWNAEKKELKKISQEYQLTPDECIKPAVFSEYNSAWSEEEKQKLNRIYSILGQAADTHAFSTSCRLIGDKECVDLQDFLKSLKERYAWKPSEEQISALKDAIRLVTPCEYGELNHLLSDLQKL